MQPDSTNWFVYGHSDATQRKIQRVFNAGTPPWRDFGNPERRTDYEFQIDDFEKQVVNAALYLRRPLLVTGEPGTGKSSLAYSIAKQLDLGTVLVWPITSRSTLEGALYRYDAIGPYRLQDERLQCEVHMQNGNALFLADADRLLQTIAMDVARDNQASNRLGCKDGSQGSARAENGYAMHHAPLQPGIVIEKANGPESKARVL